MGRGSGQLNKDIKHPALGNWREPWKLDATIDSFLFPDHGWSWSKGVRSLSSATTETPSTSTYRTVSLQATNREGALSQRVGDVESEFAARYCVGGVPLEILAESVLGKWTRRRHVSL